MRFDIITLFPELFEAHLRTGVTARAFASGQVQVKLWQLRDFADGNYRRVDDRPYGGGPGMVLLALPLLRAVDAVGLDRGETSEVVCFSPAGERLDQGMVRTWSGGPGAILVCGRYEGIDQRFIDTRVTRLVSLGDFVLSGGEIPALAVLDAVARLQAGILTQGSAEAESFSEFLLEGPCFTRPESLEVDGRRHEVPPLLLGGDHAATARFRRDESLRATAQRRPELIAGARAAGALDARDEAALIRSRL